MIVTFYSFKGGVGRSMALANIARWLQLCGLNVVVVDWDLEAPGLETFFFADEAAAARTRAQLGVIDLLNHYRVLHPNLGLDAATGRDELLARLRERLPPMQHALVEVPPPRGEAPNGSPPGRLCLLGAGWRDGERFPAYANAVQAFDWDDFYANLHGQAYFEWLRGALGEVADIVLIDSRTGVTEMGGVCTRQLADVVVALVAPNRQNIDGSGRMAASFTRPEVLAERGQRRLDLVMVPSRVDVASEIKLAFETDFEARSAPFLHDDFRQMGRRFWDLRIPYIVKYAFTERLAIGEPDGDPDLAAAYKAIAAHVAWLAPEGSRIHAVMRPEFDRVFGEQQTRLFIAADRVLARALARLDPPDLRRAREVLERLVTVAAPESGGHDVPRQWPADAFDEAHRQVVARLADAGVVRTLEGKRRLIALCNDDFIVRGDLQRWLDEDRAFLLWRQNLRTYLEDWQASGREEAALLQGSVLDTALRTRSVVAADRLDGDEHEFIARSEAWARELVARTPVLPPGPMASPAARTQPGPEAAAAPAPARRWALAGGLVAAALVALALGLAFWPRQGTGPQPTTPVAAAQAQELVALGQGQLAAGDVPAALRSFGAALDADPGSRDARLGRARAHRQGGDTAAALTDLAALLQRLPNDSDALLERAGIEGDTGHTKAALATLEALGTPSAALWSVSYRKGRLYESLGDARAALAAYDDAVRASDGRSAEALFARGVLHAAFGDRQSALADFRAVLALPAADELTRTAARARLEQYGVDTLPTAAALPHARVLIVDPADSRTAAMVVQVLSQSGFRVDGPAFAPSAAPGTVSYRAQADTASAERLRAAAQEALAKAGYRASLRIQRTTGENPATWPLELVLPPLANPRLPTAGKG